MLYLLNGHGVSNALVFTRTKHGADAVARKLTKNGVKAMAIHGDKSQNARVTALNRFKSGEIDVLVATDIAARGIDIVELPTVINYNVPEEPETYIHRIGRTGRAGMDGVAITFCCSDELESFRNIEKLIRKTVDERQCEWSVADMQPTKPEPRERNPRKQSAAAEKPENAQKKQPKQHTSQREKASVQKNTAPTEKKTEPSGQKRPSAPKSPQKPQEKAEAVQAQKPTEKSAKKPQEKPIAKQEQKSAEKKPRTQSGAKQGKKKQDAPENRQGSAEQARRPAPTSPRRPASEREKPKAAEPTGNRRYADSGEHDGATGQQIVTNFNRSVWLEFNEPPKRSKKPWLLGGEQAAAKNEKKEEKTAVKPEKPSTPSPAAQDQKSKPARGGVFSRLRRGKRENRS